VGGRAAIDGEPRNLARNVALDAALFDWAVRTAQRRVLYFSSSAVYPAWLQRSADDRCLREWDVVLHDPCEPDGRYGWAKLTGERMAEAARLSGLPVTVVRPFSGYGGDQDRAYPFRAIVDRAAAGDLSVWGPPGQTRDWMHIADVVRGALAVVDDGTDEPVNLCTGIGVEFGDLARMVWEEANPGRPAPEVTYDVTKPTGVLYRVGHPSRMLTMYTPTVTVRDGIRRALAMRRRAG
jgi:nucleoside-diphosphate-sugar epimerase